MERLVGISTGPLQKIYGPKRAIEIAKEIGADTVNLSLESGYNYRKKDNVYAEGEDAIQRYFSELGDHAAKLGIKINQTHGRISGLFNDEEKDAACIENLRLDCLATKALGADTCVVHTATTIHMGPDASREDMHRLNDKLFLSALPHARALGINLATETFGDAAKYGCCDFFGNMDEFLEAYDRIAGEYGYGDCFRVYMDTGHTNKAIRFGNNPSPQEAIRMLGSRINTLHLHDNDTMTDQHKIPMTGCIDWHAVLTALDEVGYGGVYMLEISLNHFGAGFEIEEAAFGVKVMRQILREYDKTLENK